MRMARARRSSLPAAAAPPAAPSSTFAARAGGPRMSQRRGARVRQRRRLPRVADEAQLHVGAVYLNLSVPSSGGPQEPCVLPGIYVGQAFGPCDASGRCGADVDLLSPTLTPFRGPARARSITPSRPRSGSPAATSTPHDDRTPILDVAGTATRGADAWPFTATITIGPNRAIPPPNAAMPGADPICRQRIASLIPIDFTLSDGGTLDLRIDPRGMFDSVDFSSLGAAGSATPLVIPDTSSGAGQALYKGLPPTPASTASPGPHEQGETHAND